TDRTETVRSGGPRREHGHPAPLSPAPGPGPLLTTRIAGEGSGAATMTKSILNDIENTWCARGYCHARFDPCLRRVELVLDDERGESGERRFDLVPGLRGREEELGTVGLRELRHVPFLESGVRGQVRLVHGDEDRDLADGLLADETHFRLDTFHRQAMSPLRGASALWPRLLNASRLVLAGGRQLATERPSRLRTIVPSRWNRSSTFSPVFAEV